MHLLPLEVRSHRSLPSRIVDNMANAAFLVGAILYLSCVPSALAAEAAESTTRLEGDLGLGVLAAQGIVVSKSNTASPIPYANATYGRWFARIDTGGLKTAKIGWGYLEVIGRFNSDALKADTPRLAGLNDRKMSAPIGVGSLQVTPVGAFFINAFHDFGASRGNLLEGVYALRFDALGASWYPQVGVQHWTSDYVRYHYGVSTVEASRSGISAYSPGAATSSFIGALVEVPLADKWWLNLEARHAWLGSAIANSPIVTRKTQTTGFLAASYRF